MSNKAINGAEFLVRKTAAEDIFIPEEFSEEQRMMAQACQDFIDLEILPISDEIDSMKDHDLVPRILKKAGEMGLLGISVPEMYGGMGMSFNTSMLIADIIGSAGSFSTTYGTHTGIGTLPILYYGTEEQKQKYLPKLATAEWAACYCLTEPDAGSDANSGKSKAVRSSEGTHYLLNGQKMWITNAGFADVMIVFAKIEDDKNLSAFIVEKGFGGITMNEEEKKMGIKGSSTRQVFFNDCPVPIENLLSERGNGFKIAVNILNIGRIKLGAAAIGSSREVIDKAINYSNERVQFNLQISKFGAIRHKLAEMAIRNFAVESAAYRAGQNIDDACDSLMEEGMEIAQAKLKSTEAFAIECAIIKVWGSEMLDYVVDEGVQVYGGMGYSADAPMERAYRDSRINRIFEGTNEVNRLLIVDMLLKRAMKGELDLMGPAQAVAGELMSIPDFAEPDSALFAYEKRVLQNLKKVGLMIAGSAVQKLMMTLSKEQEILMNIADIMGYVYLAESTLLRAEKLVHMRGEELVKGQIDIARVYLHSAADHVYLAGKEALYSFAEGDELKMMLMGLRRFTKVEPFNSKEARQRIAKQLIEANKYCF